MHESQIRGFTGMCRSRPKHNDLPSLGQNFMMAMGASTKMMCTGIPPAYGDWMGDSQLMVGGEGGYNQHVSALLPRSPPLCEK